MEKTLQGLETTARNPKLRNIYFRLIHNDFFTGVRMKKYRMTKDDECPRYNVYM
jgi:hypothetical protein